MLRYAGQHKRLFAPLPGATSTADASAWLARLLVTTAVLALPIAASPARADCASDSTTSPGTIVVTCSDVIADPFELRGDGAVGVDGSNVDVTSTAQIATAATALSIFSTGGGSGGSAVGPAGDGGDITAVISGSLSASNAGARGVIVAVNGGSTFDIAAAPGDGGAIDLTLAGDVTVTGQMSQAVYAFSGGGIGGRGSADREFGSGGDITLSVSDTGSIRATDPSSGAIEAESSSGTTGNVRVTNRGEIVAGSSGIRATGGATVEVINYGTIETQPSGTDVNARGADVLLENFGTLSGRVTLDGSASAQFFNRLGGLYSGLSVDLNKGTALNEGTVSPGGKNTIATTTVMGNFAQGSRGVIEVDADWTGSAGHNADLLHVFGQATLSGTVVVNPINFPDSAVASNAGLMRTFAIIHTNGSVIFNAGLAVEDTAAVDYELLFPTTDTVSVEAKINFAPSGLALGGGALGGNQVAVGTSLNNAVSSGGGDLPFVPELLTLKTNAELGAALNQLTPASDGGMTASALSTGAAFASQLLSCRVTGEGDAHAVIREGQCVWARGNVRRQNNDGGDGGVSYQEDSFFVSGGAQFDLGGPWRVGVGLGYEELDLVTDSRAQTEGDRAHFGGVLKYNPGPLLLAAGLTGGFGSFDNERQIAFGGFASTATSEFDSNFLTGTFTAAYHIDIGRAVYLKPQIHGSVTRLSRDAYTETGSAALRVDETSDTVFSVSPGLEVGTEVRLMTGIARPYIRGGFTWRSEDSFQTSASFAGGPAGASPFTITSGVDETVGDIAAGVDFISPGDGALRVEYGGQFGDQTEQHTGSLKMSLPF